MGPSCGTACNGDNECQTTTHFCDNRVCRQKRGAAQPCTSGTQCASGFCVDGVCCSSACTELCRACNVTGAVGTCTAVPAGTDPRAVCPATSASTCHTDGECNGAGACRLPGAGTPCGGSSCAASLETPPPTCNGSGSCVLKPARDCGAYLCAGATCGSTCTSSTQCNPGFACAAGSCQPLPGPVLHWRFDEATGGTALDASGNNLNGSYIGAVGAPGPSSTVPPLTSNNPRSRAFVRANEHAVRLAPLPAALRFSSGFTVSVWFRSTSLDPGGSEIVNAADSYNVRLRPGELEVAARTNVGGVLAHHQCRRPVSNHLDGNWHHLAGVYAATEMRVYYDGVDLACGKASAAIVYDRGTDLFVGRHGNGSADFDFDGNIDDVRIYGRVLSAAEIARLAQGK